MDITQATEVWVSTSKNGDYVSAIPDDDAVRFVKPTEWQHIETAPRDGKNFLATDGQYFAVGDFCEFFGFRIHHYATCQEYDWYPTHWMPLPQPKEND